MQSHTFSSLYLPIFRKSQQSSRSKILQDTPAILLLLAVCCLTQQPAQLMPGASVLERYSWIAEPPPSPPETPYPLYVEPVELVGNALQLPCNLHLGTRFPLTFLRLLLEVRIQRKANGRDV